MHFDSSSPHSWPHPNSTCGKVGLTDPVFVMLLAERGSVPAVRTNGEAGCGRVQTDVCVHRQPTFQINRGPRNRGSILQAQF